VQGALLRVAFRHFALRSRHPRSVALACAVEAAGLQGRFWEMHDALFADQGRTDDPHLWDRARALGLDIDRFESDRRSPAVARRVAEDVRGALRAGVTTTPTLFADGVAYSGTPDAALVARLTQGATG
jgi:protein-disulfide isomerase